MLNYLMLNLIELSNFLGSVLPIDEVKRAEIEAAEMMKKQNSHQETQTKPRKK